LSGCLIIHNPRNLFPLDGSTRESEFYCERINAVIPKRFSVRWACEILLEHPSMFTDVPMHYLVEPDENNLRGTFWETLKVALYRAIEPELLRRGQALGMLTTDEWEAEQAGVEVAPCEGLSQ
jgi:hypothetical protein